ncbi:unnamed protein product, partial [Macrosiphum euphorbiae]
TLIRFFSLKTAVALELAVKLGTLPQDALVTAHFIKIIDEWFTLTASKLRKTSITKNNKECKYDFLEKVITLFENLTIGNGWKPLNVGFIMSSLSLIDIAETLFNCGFDFLICHRFTQDAIENVFSQIRRKSGATPTATQCLSALKIISVSQFISDVKRSSYVTDSDTYLIDFFQNPDYESIHSNINNFSDMFTHNTSNLPSDAFETETINHILTCISKIDLNSLYHIAGSTTNMLLKHCCKECAIKLQQNGPNDELFESIKTYTTLLNKGGLKHPCMELFLIVCNCEILYVKYKTYIIHNSSHNLINKIVNDLCIEFPTCFKSCNIKERIVKHFFTVRSYATVSFSVNSKKRKKIYGTATAKKR